MSGAKSFIIPEELFVEAYALVKARKGSAGVDGQTLDVFEERKDDNLYKLWNRMSSGSYFPQPVRAVKIPKAKGGIRTLGVPTVTDRVAQMVVTLELEQVLESVFHPDSYGYRPGKSAIDAIGTARKRCWEYDWVLDLDIKGFFDNLRHDLLMKALEKHTDKKWHLLYVKRWLEAPMKDKKGKITERTKGTPQGGVISPLLANLFLHYAFDEWISREYKDICFERYCDDIIVHCHSYEAACSLKEHIAERMKECGLELHPHKTKIVYCKDGRRKGKHKETSFDFLGYTFRGREARNKAGKYFIGFLPAVSNDSKKRVLNRIRIIRIHRRSDLSINELAKIVNPIIRGWTNYFSRFYASEIHHVLFIVNNMYVKWAMRKYKKLRRKRKKAIKWLNDIRYRQPDLMASWIS